MPNWNGTWEGGRTYETKDGRTVYVLRRGAGGKVQITLRARNRDEALAELALFNRDPRAYLTASAERATDPAPTVDGPLRIDGALIQRLVTAMQADGLTDRHIENVERYLAAWSSDLKGRDLRRVTVRDLNAVLDSYPRQERDGVTGQVRTVSQARRHRITALKTLTAWLRKRGELSPAEDASLAVTLPPPRPEKARRFAVGEAKGYRLADVQAIYAAIDGWETRKHGVDKPRMIDVQSVRDVFLVAAKTGMHGTEIERLASGKGRLAEVAGHGEIAGTITFVHKSGRVHVQSIDAQTVAAVKRLQARGSAPVDSWCRKVTNKAAERLGLKVRIKFGQFRHSRATWLRECGEIIRPASGGLSLEEVAEELGHFSSRTTARFYDQTTIPPMRKVPLRLVHRDDPPVADAPTHAGSRRSRRNAPAV